MLDRDRAMHWLKTGAQPTDTVRDILSREGLLLGLHMEHKGASAAEIAEAIDTHADRTRNREAVKAKTGKDWAGWFAVLDRAGARKMSHTEIATRLYERHPPRYEYLLTEKGKALAPVLKALYAWGERHG